jgi:hypothetical protein
VCDQRVEIPVPQKRRHLGDHAGREPHRLGQPFLLDSEELTERAVTARRFVERPGVLGIVQVKEIEPLEVQRFQALLERAAGA